MRLKDKVAIVTGGCRGIGLATVIRFAEEGATVIAADVDVNTEEMAEATLDGYAGQIVPMRLDVTNRNPEEAHSVDAVVKKTMDEFGRIDGLINNAGITRDARLVKMTEDQFDAVINVNLKGVYNCTQVIAPIMTAQKSGSIMNAASVVAIYGNFGQTNYVASKAAVIGMTRVWAREVGKYGVRVNAVAPGWIKTRMTAKVPEKVIDKMLEWVPLARMGEPLDIANAYLWLTSDESVYVSGHILSVDGGARV